VQLLVINIVLYTVAWKMCSIKFMIIVVYLKSLKNRSCNPLWKWVCAESSLLGWAC